MESNNPKSSSFIEKFVLGGISAGIAKTIVAPLERIKLLMQNQIIIDHLDKKYNGNIDCIKRVYNEQGFLSFWRGNFANIARFIPAFALNYSLKEHFSKLLKIDHKKDSNKTRMLKNFVSSYVSAALTILITYPLDFARTKIGVDVHKIGEKKEYRGIIDVLVKTYKKDGIYKGVYAGFIMTLIGGSLYRSLYFGLYDSIKIYYDIEKSKIIFYLISVLTTGTAGILTLPFDTIRRRLIVQTGHDSKKYKGLINCAYIIYKDEGLKGFSKGGYANFMRSFGSALILNLNDHVQALYKKYYVK